MAYDNELLKGIWAIYKEVCKNPGIGRNVLKDKVLSGGKISNKEKFNKILDSLVASGKIVEEKDRGGKYTIGPNLVYQATIEKQNNDYFVQMYGSKKRYAIDRSVGQGYQPGDAVDVALEHIGGSKTPLPLIVGRTNIKIDVKKDKFPHKKAKFYNEGALVKEDAENMLLGRVVKLSHNDLVFIPNKKNIEPRQIPILNDVEEWSAFQDKICIMKLEDNKFPGMGGNIVDVKGDAGNPIHEYDAIAESYGAIMSWTGENIEREIEEIPTKVDESELNLITEKQARAMQKGHTVDLRHLPFATVDPADCKDMDDAIYSRFNDDGDYECYIAVANVTKYVDLNTEIGQRYFNGSFTIYAPNKAYNVLPTKLSTGICSLNPNEDRLSFVVKAIVDKTTGKVKKYDIFDAIIRSKNKYSYEQAQEIIDRIGEQEGAKEFLQYKGARGEEVDDDQQLLMNYYAAQKIKQGFSQRQMIRFISNHDRKIDFDKDLDDVADIQTIPHLAYHEVVEAFMITANECTAKYAKDNNLNNVYRVHEKPDDEKSSRAEEFFDIMGINFDGDLSAHGTQVLIDKTKGTPYEEVVNEFLIKMQSKAKYSDKLYKEADEDDEEKDDEFYSLLGERISHFALQSPHYSHTTSPIRRLPDYATQYNILAHIHGTKPLSAELVNMIAEQANERQDDVDQAEKDFNDISSVFYCEKHIGDVMHGRVSKIKWSTKDNEVEDEIFVVVKNNEKGIYVDIPLSELIGRPAKDCHISEQFCAVYDGRGNTILTLCKPIDFVIAGADRKTMIVTGVPCERIKITEKNSTKTRDLSAPYFNKNSKKVYRVGEGKKKERRRQKMQDIEFDREMRKEKGE